MKKIDDTKKNIIKIVLEESCYETKKHHIATNENESYYWCVICGQSLDKNGKEI